jgi:subtilisin family serine protease
VEAGTPCSLSAGNDGASGVFNASTAAGGIGVLSVGSVDSVTSPSNLTVGNFSINGGAVQKFVYDLGGGAFPSETFPLYAINFDTTDAAQACSPLPAGTPDLTNFVVLIRRGGCTFETKANNAHAFGARYILFYNNQPSGILAPSIGAAAGILGEAMVFASQGVSWIQTLQSGSPISITVSTPSESKWIYSNDVNLVTGGYMSTYSTWSPTFEMYITPVVSAPGGNILSTYPLANGGYAVLSGTSMACPYVAGIVAIIKQARGRTLAPGVINALIASTATPIGFNAGTATRYPFLAPVIQQGGGLIDAYQAVHSQTIIRPPYISFNDTRHFLDHADISIFNVGKEAVTYTFSYIAAGTAYTLAAVGDQIPDTFTPEMVTTSATIKFDKRALSVKPNEIGTVKVQLNLPVGLTEARLPVYSGYIAINASNGDYFTVPYAGLDADLSKAAVMNTVVSFCIAV